MSFKSNFSYLQPSDRVSYLQSADNELDYSTVIDPCRSLTDVFNSVCEDVDEPQHLKVFLRIRPLFSEENITSQDGNIEILNSKNVLVTAPVGSHACKSNFQGITKMTHRFRYSHVYGQEATQKDIFEDSTQELVKQLVNSQNCLLFTYGATNSGKTYTIQGTNSNPGLLPRTLDTLFNIIGEQQYMKNDLKPQHFCGVVRLNQKDIAKEEELKEQLLKTGNVVGGNGSLCKSTCSLDSKLSINSDVLCVDEESLADNSDRISDCTARAESLYEGIVDDSRAVYAVFLSFAEIYNEYIYDLLDKSIQSKKGKKNPLVLGEDRNGSIYIKGIREIRVKSREEALQILEVGKQNLHFAATKLNHHSSRSHCIFTLKLVRLSDPLNPHLARVSMLSLCDLAGAERAAKTMNCMDRLKEASNINTSLLVLGRCLTALRQNQSINKQGQGCRKPIPVPYRDSKVTRLFQTFFTGKGKVALIVNISLSNLLFDETLKVLKFSALASKVTITQEKPQILNSTVEYSKRNSQFAHFLTQSLNMSTASSRLSLPWSNKSIEEVTFGGGDACEGSKMEPVPEEEDEESDERYEALMQLIEKLKEKLLKVNQEKSDLESNLRKELCDAFSKKIVEIEDSWRSRVEEREIRADELMEWRINHVMGSVKKAGTRKRLRTESEEIEEMVPSILLAREEIKVRELEEENEAIKASLKSSMQINKAMQEEKTKLLFKLSLNSKLLEKYEAEMNKNKHSYSMLSEASESLIVEDFHHQIKSLENSIHEKDEELKNVKDMLFQAAQEFMTKEQETAALKTSVSAAKDREAQQSILIHELKNQLNEMKDELTKQGDYLEEREQEVHELRALLSDKKASLTGLETSLEDQQSLKEELEHLSRKNSKLEDELSNVRAELEEIKNLQEINEKNIEHENGIEDLKTELITLHKKYMKLEDENEKFLSEISALENEKKIKAEICSQTHETKIISLEEELQSIISKYNSSEERVTDLSSKIENVGHQVKLTEECKASLKKKYEEVNTENELLQIRIAELEACMQKMALNTISEEESQKENENLKACLEEKERKIESIFIELKERDNDSNLLERKIENLEETMLLKENQEKELWQEMNNLHQALDENKKEKDSILMECEVLKKTLTEKEKELTRLTEEVSDFEGYKNDMKNKMETFVKEIELKDVLHGEKIKELEERTSEILNDNNKLIKENKDLEALLEEIRNKCNSISEVAEKEKENERLLINEVSQLKDNNSKLSDELCLLHKKEENQNLEIQQLKTELADAEKLKIRLIEKEIKMDEELRIAKSHLQKAESVLDEKEVTIKKISAKTETLDKKVDEAEQETECYRTKCQLLEKEVAALREARTEEVNQLKVDLESKEALLEQKEQEVNTLQQEVKRTLQMSLASEISENKSTKEKPENTELFDLRDRLRESESEKSSLLMQISSLQQELSDTHEITKSVQFSFHSDIPDKNHSQKQSETVHKKGRGRNFSKSVKECFSRLPKFFSSFEFAKCSETSSTNDSPVTRKHTRPGRSAKTKKDNTSSVTSTTQNSKRALADTSEGEDLSNSQPQYSRGRRGKADSTQKSVTNIPDSPEVGFKVPRSTRKKNLNLQFHEDSDSNEKESAEEENDKDEDEFVPRKTTRSSRKPRRGGKSTSKLYNPHLDDKENT
ncbi:Kinesin-like protein KIF20A [Armadillidium nasatum]|uniref:Kinesin-like protein KIF20A n=1 Tax=Armadillidium nasatum TaxID=96803 RepID=A0A5N5T688_9CRUS|nr:Kinesin-like protein KIF20A [Armadillidium nasatum]